MARCCFRHNSLYNNNAFRHDGTNQCWLDNTNVALFKIDNEEKHYCIFHAPEEIEPIESENKHFWNPARRESSKHDRFYELINTWNADTFNTRVFILPKTRINGISLSFRTLKESIILEECEFFGDVKFHNMVFSKLVILSGSIFNGDAYFNNSVFHGTADFNNTVFKKNSDFSSCSFNSHAFFEKSSHKYCSYAFSKFNDLVIFSRLNSDRINFISCEFNGPCLLDSMHLETINIGNNRLEKPISFERCSIKRLTYTTHVGERLTFNGGGFISSGDNEWFWDFRDSDCSRVAFHNMPLNHVDFTGADLLNTRFLFCSWDTGNKRYQALPRHENLLNSERSLNELNLLYESYQQLKDNLEASGDHHSSGDFHYRELEVRQEILKQRNIKPLERNILWFYHFIADYGESYKKLFISLIASFPLTAVVVSVIEGIRYRVNHDYGLISSVNDILNRTFYNFTDHLYTIIFGLIPSGYSRKVLTDGFDKLYWLSKSIIVIEGIIAVTLGTLFVMSIRRRFKR